MRTVVVYLRLDIRRQLFIFSVSFICRFFVSFSFFSEGFGLVPPLVFSPFFLINFEIGGIRQEFIGVPTQLGCRCFSVMPSLSPGLPIFFFNYQGKHGCYIAIILNNLRMINSFFRGLHLYPSQDLCMLFVQIHKTQFDFHLDGQNIF